MTKFFNLSTDTTLGGDSPADYVVPSQKAIKTYVDNQGGGGGGLPDQTGNAGKFLTTNGTNASWSNKPLVNTATGTNSLTILGTASSISKALNIGVSSSVTKTRGLAIGMGSTASGTNANAIGYSAQATANGALALGTLARATAGGAIQLAATGSTSYVDNSDANTFKVANQNGNFEIMSADGTIPEARLADTTSAAQGQVLTLDANLNAVWAAAGGGGDIDCGTMS